MSDTRNLRDDEGVSVVYISKWKAMTFGDDTYATVEETLHQAFYGDDARVRAERFKANEEENGDFPESEGWHWFIHSSAKANEFYGVWLTDQMFGPSEPTEDVEVVQG